MIVQFYYNKLARAAGGVQTLVCTAVVWCTRTLPVSLNSIIIPNSYSTGRILQSKGCSRSWAASPLRTALLRAGRRACTALSSSSSVAPVLHCSFPRDSFHEPRSARGADLARLLDTPSVSRVGLAQHTTAASAAGPAGCPSSVLERQGQRRRRRRRRRRQQHGGDSRDCPTATRFPLWTGKTMMMAAGS